MTNVVWSGATSGDWSVATDWSPAIVPNNGTSTSYDVSITPSGVYTVTIASSESYKVDSVTLNASGATLAIKGALALNGSIAALTVTSGTLQLSGTITGGAVKVNGGTLVMAGNSTYAGAYTQSGSALKLNTRTLTLSGASSFSNGADIDGQGTLVTSKVTTIVDPGNSSYAALTLGAAAQWTNSGTVNDGGIISVGDSSGLTASIVNNAGGIINFTTDDASVVNASVNGSNGRSTFANAGTLAKTGGTGVSQIWSSITDSGTINVATGTIEIDAGGSFSGTLAGNGTLAFAGGTSTMLASTTLTVQNLLVDGGALNLSSGVSTYAGVAVVSSGSLKLGANLTLKGNYTETGGDLLLNGHTLTLSGNDFFGTSNNIRSTDVVFVDGPGTLQTSGIVTLKDIGANYDQLTLGGGAAWSNSGKVYIGDAIGVGDNSGTLASITNTSTGVLDFTSDDGAIVNAQNSNGIYGSSTLTNAGLLEKTSGLSTSHVFCNVSDTGTIKVATGTLEFDNGGSFAGPITGNGVVAFAGGVVNLKSASSFNVGHLDFTGAAVNLASNFTSYAGTFEQTGGSIKLGANLSLSGYFSQSQGAIALNGDSLTLGGSVLLGAGPQFIGSTVGGTIDGAGSLVTSATVTIKDPFLNSDVSTPQLVLGGTMNWTNHGVVNDGGVISVGDTSGASATINNSGTFNFTSDDGAILNASFQGPSGQVTGSSTFNNTGTLAKTGGTGVSSVYSTINDTNTVAAYTGTLEFDGGGNFSGSFIGSGAISFGGSSSTVSLSTFTVGQFIIDGGTVSLTAPGKTYAGALTESSGDLALQNNFSASGSVSLTGGSLELNGNTLALSGSVSIGLPPIFSGNLTYTDIDGSGNLNTSGTTTILNPTYYNGSNIAGQNNIQLVLGGGLTWTNSGTVNDGGVIAAGDAVLASAAIVNALGASFNLTSDAAAITNNSLGQSAVGNSTFTNQGILAKTGGTGTSSISSWMNDSGTINVETGTLQFAGGGDFSGALTGAGTLAFEGGTATIDNGTKLTVANLLFNGANAQLPSNFTTYAGSITQSAGTVTLDANLTDSGAFAQTGGEISLQYNLTLTGAATFGTLPTTGGGYVGGGAIDGPGVLMTQAATTISDPGYYNGSYEQNGTIPELFLGGSVTWINSGTVNDGGGIYIGDAAGLNAMLQNNAGATFDFTSDDGAIYDNDIGGGQLGSATFTNAGLLEKASGDGTSEVDAAMVDTGTISIAIGTIDFTNGGSFSGAVNGAGTVEFNGGNDDVETGASFTIGQMLLNAGSLEVSTSLTYAGVFTETGGDLSIDDGKTFTLSNYGYFSGGTVDGSGTLAVSGQLSLDGDDLANSAETVASSGSIVGSGVIGPAVANAGLIEATGGTLTMGGAVTGAGTLRIDPNAELELQAGTAEAVNFNGPGGVLWLDHSVAYSGTIGGLGAGDKIVLGNTKATAAAFSNGAINVTLAGGVHELLKVSGGGAGLSLSLSLDSSGDTILSIGQGASNAALHTALAVSHAHA